MTKKTQSLAMMISLICIYLAGAAVAQVPPPADDAYLTSVAVNGARGEDGRYQLEIEFSSKDAPGLFDSLLIRAWPSQTLLFAHRAKGQGIQAEDDRPLALVQGPLDDFRHTIAIPYDPRIQEDRFLAVDVTYGGQSFPVFWTKYQRDFSVGFSTHAPAATLTEMDFVGIDPNPSITCGSGQRCHCCSGGNCAQMCDCCDGPAFDCNLVNCTSSCGQWPPACV